MEFSLDLSKYFSTVSSVAINQETQRHEFPVVIIVSLFSSDQKPNICIFSS